MAATAQGVASPRTQGIEDGARDTTGGTRRGDKWQHGG